MKIFLLSQRKQYQKPQLDNSWILAQLELKFKLLSNVPDILPDMHSTFVKGELSAKTYPFLFETIGRVN